MTSRANRRPGLARLLPEDEAGLAGSEVLGLVDGTGETPPPVGATAALSNVYKRQRETNRGAQAPARPT